MKEEMEKKTHTHHLYVHMLLLKKIFSQIPAKLADTTVQTLQYKVRDVLFHHPIICRRTTVSVYNIIPQFLNTDWYVMWTSAHAEWWKI